MDPAIPADAPTLSPGAMVGRFRVEEALGAGGMGEVYRAWDATLERSVALKSLRAGIEREAGALERFRREALALAQLNHPNVCQVHDWVEAPSGTYIAMELVEGETLDQAAPRLKPREKLKVVLSVARALEAAHAKGLVHRDLKPANIMVARREGQDPLVKVLDFGLARLLDASGEVHSTPPPVPNLAQAGSPAASQDSLATALPASLPPETRAASSGGSSGHSWERLTQVGAFMGSPGYAGPEQIQGQPTGPAGDVFSLGVVAWELLAGEHPYPGEGRARMQAMVRGERRPLKGRHPHGLADLLRGMLDPHPFRRPPSAQVARTLEDLLRPRNALRWALASAALALLASAGAYTFLRRGILSDLTRRHAARIVIMPFGNTTGDADLDPTARIMLPEMLDAALRTQPKLAPLDAESLAKARSALHLPTEGDLAWADEARLASALGASLVLQGTLSRDGGDLLLAFELRDAQGRVRRAGRIRTATARAAAALPLAQGAARDLLKAIDPLSPDSGSLLPDLPPEALDAFSRAAGLMDKGDFKDAAPLFRDATRQAPEYVPAVLGYARCLARLADAPPEPVFEWARWAARAQGNHLLEYQALRNLMICSGDKGDWAQADRTGQEALALVRTLGEPTLEAGLHTTFGVHFQKRNRTAEAEAEYLQALDMFRTAGDRLSETRVLNNLAVLQKGRGDLAGAAARYQAALETVTALGDRWGESFLRSNLGDLALAQGNLDQAEAEYRSAMALREAIGDQSGLIYTCIGLASVSQSRGDLDKALESENRALDLARKTQQKPMEALALYNLGELNRDAGRFEEAQEAYRQSQALQHDLGDTAMEAHALAGEAECQARQGHRAAARALMDRSRALSQEDTPYLLRAQAWVAKAEGHPDEAKALFVRALAAARTQAPEIVRELTAAAR